MKKALEYRQALIDNYDNLIKSSSGNKNQLSMFEKDEEFEWKISPNEKAVHSIVMLEKERDVLGFITSVDYIPSNFMINELLGIKNISETNSYKKIVKSSGVCIRKDVKQGKYGMMNTITFGDSYRKIEMIVHQKSVNNFKIGEIYLLKYHQFNPGKVYATHKLIKAFKLSALENYKLFKGGYLKVTSNGSLDTNKAIEFLNFIKSIESDAGGTTILFVQKNNTIKTKVLLSCNSYNKLINYFKLNVKYEKKNKEHS